MKHQHLQSRSWDKSDPVGLPLSHASQPHVGCSGGTFQTSHTPLMTAFRRRKPSPAGSRESCPPFVWGTGMGCEGTGEGGAFCFLGGLPQIGLVRLGRGDKSGCARHQHNVHLHEQVEGAPQRGFPGVFPAMLGERPDLLTALCSTTTVPHAGLVAARHFACVRPMNQQLFKPGGAAARLRVPPWAAPLMAPAQALVQPTAVPGQLVLARTPSMEGSQPSSASR